MAASWDALLTRRRALRGGAALAALAAAGPALARLDPKSLERLLGQGLPPLKAALPGDAAQAVDLANDTRYGLNAFVHTTNLQRAHTVSRQLQAGSVWVNTRSDIQPQSPYGGYKHSGIGRSGGVEGLREFRQTKNIRIKVS